MPCAAACLDYMPNRDWLHLHRLLIAPIIKVKAAVPLMSRKMYGRLEQ
jgi:hypothetical protein